MPKTWTRLKGWGNERGTADGPRSEGSAAGERAYARLSSLDHSHQSREPHDAQGTTSSSSFVPPILTQPKEARRASLPFHIHFSEQSESSARMAQLAWGGATPPPPLTTKFRGNFGFISQHAFKAVTLHKRLTKTLAGQSSAPKHWSHGAAICAAGSSLPTRDQEVSFQFLRLPCTFLSLPEHILSKAHPQIMTKLGPAW